MEKVCILSDNEFTKFLDLISPPLKFYLDKENVLFRNFENFSLDFKRVISFDSLRNKSFFEKFTQYLNKDSCFIFFDSLLSNPLIEFLLSYGVSKEKILILGGDGFLNLINDFSSENKIQKISLNSVLEDIDNIADTLMEFTQRRETFLFVNFNILESFELGGLTARQLIYLVQRLSKLNNLKLVNFENINSDETLLKLGLKLTLDLI